MLGKFNINTAAAFPPKNVKKLELFGKHLILIPTGNVFGFQIWPPNDKIIVKMV